MDNGNYKDSKSPLSIISFILIVVGIVMVIGLPKMDEVQSEEYQNEEEVSTPDLTELNQMLQEYGQYEKETVGLINGHQYVDLGLPSGLKWATCNIGAKSPEEAGDLFAWGEVQTKDNYTPENSETYKKSREWLLENGYIDQNGNLTPSHDVATEKWGSPWRMPTEEELSELYRIPKAWGTLNGKNGMILMDNGGRNKVFLPAVGYDTLYAAYTGGEHGCYWGAAIYQSLTELSYQIFFCEKQYLSSSNFRYVGLPVRPVSD